MRSGKPRLQSLIFIQSGKAASNRFPCRVSSSRSRSKNGCGLRAATGRDYGLDLAAWNVYLLKSEFAPTYMHEAAWDDVRAIAQAGMRSEERQHLLQQDK